MIGGENRLDLGGPDVNADLDTLATALYVTIDDDLTNHPEWAPQRPTVGIVPKLSDAELVTLGVLQALLGFTSRRPLHDAVCHTPMTSGWWTRHPRGSL